MKATKIKKKGNLSLHYKDNCVFTNHNTLYGVYFVKRKISKNLYNVEYVYTRKTWTGIFEIIIHGRIEDLDDFKARAIREFDKLVKQEDNV